MRNYPQGRPSTSSSSSPVVVLGSRRHLSSSSSLSFVVVGRRPGEDAKGEEESHHLTHWGRPCSSSTSSSFIFRRFFVDFSSTFDPRATQQNISTGGFSTFSGSGGRFLARDRQKNCPERKTDPGERAQTSEGPRRKKKRRRSGRVRTASRREQNQRREAFCFAPFGPWGEQPAIGPWGLS